MKTTKKYDDWLEYYTELRKNALYNYEKNRQIERKTQFESDEEILEKMDLKTIENFLRKKKLSNINK